MMNSKRGKKGLWLSLLAVVMLVLASCTSVDEGTDEVADDGDDAAESTDDGDDGGDDAGDDGGDAVAQRDFRFVVVSHGQSSDPFWSVAANGVQAAADDMGVQVEYQAPGTFDMVEMSQIIDAAVASDPDGLVVTIPDADALGASIQAAVDAGIPVLSMNSGAEVFRELGVLRHVGQTEFEAGVIAGERFAEQGISSALCINQEVGNVALDQRCDGFEEGLGGSVEVIPVELADPAGSQSTIAGALNSNPDAEAVLALGPTGAVPALAAVQEAGADIALATFDLGPEVLRAIDEGDMEFAIDQAQYLQGYLPIVMLTQYLETGALPLGSVDFVILTGPQLVTAETAADVIEQAEQGLR